MLSVVAFSNGCGSQQAKPIEPSVITEPPPFDETLREHLDAIASRDLERYMNTVANRDDVTVLLLSGTIISGKKGVEELQKTWFWRFELAN